jgi:hypothetical protein
MKDSSESVEIQVVRKFFEIVFGVATEVKRIRQSCAHKAFHLVFCGLSSIFSSHTWRVNTYQDSRFSGSKPLSSKSFFVR